MIVKRLAQEHNAMPWPGLEPRPFDVMIGPLGVQLKRKKKKATNLLLAYLCHIIPVFLSPL